MTLQSLTQKQHNDLIERAIEFAASLQERVQDSIATHEKSFYYKMQHIIENPEYKALFMELLDSSVLSNNPAHSHKLIERILRRYEFGEFFTLYEKMLLYIFLQVGRYAPSLSVPFFIKQIRKEAGLMMRFSMPTSSPKSHIANYYFIAKKALSQEIIKDNITMCKKALDNSHITHISIKPSAFFTQMWEGSFIHSRDELARSLKELFAYASQQSQAQNLPKIITLDMEEHRFLQLSVSAFMEALSGYSELEAGIALQAYIPESFSYLMQLCDYAKARVDSGGKPVHIRLVKGANMQAEKFYAAKHNGRLPMFSQKLCTDANYKKMLHYLIDNAHYRHTKLGVASHNVFELAYAYMLLQHCVEPEYREHFVFEMSMGISMQASRILGEYHTLMLYTPVCDTSSFQEAIAYLLRRLDENTGEENFMASYYAMRVGDSAWQAQKAMFLDSLAYIPKLSCAPIAVQDRAAVLDLQSSDGVYETDTEFFAQANYQWLIEALAQELPKDTIQATYIKEAQMLYGFDGREIRKVAFAKGFDENIVPASLSRLENLIAIFNKATHLLQEKRGQIITTAALEIGKVPMQTDMEISELITLLRFYPKSLQDLCDTHAHTSFMPKGRGLVIGSAHSHLSISFAPVLASLACGDQVVFKPSSLVISSSYMVCECLWEAGIPRDMLCFTPMQREDFRQALANMRTDLFAFVVGFGKGSSLESIATAQPMLPLIAHPTATNAMIITQLADYDQAIKHAISSAFFYGGVGVRKLSVLIVEQSVLDDTGFMQGVLACARSLHYGTPYALQNALGVVLDSNHALEAIQGAFALKPQRDGQYMGAGIIYASANELSAIDRYLPLLYIIKADDIKHAIALANTLDSNICVLESRDEDEWVYFRKNAKAHTLLINEPTIHTASAKIITTPSGSLSHTIGTYNDIIHFVRPVPNACDENLATSIIEPKFKRLLASGDIVDSRRKALENALKKAKSYVYYRNTEFMLSHDCALEYGAKHLLDYKAISTLAYRVSSNDSLEDVLGVIIGAQACKVELIVSFEAIDEDLAFLRENLAGLGLIAKFVQESLQDFIARIPQNDVIRYHTKASAMDSIYQAAAISHKRIIPDKPLDNGRFELLWYYRERVISIVHHRYGVFAENKLAKLLE
ncbi:bifunctional proline dehydrogenase/L-glutamate gamma-semialdehyde dehydrogenase [Helicobacter sp. XJK30-2]|uniref:Bifunctional proline dehydrogenase/L-glutamate gamma-semialdehyde dehydrogenase n=1 Tax=Helicobacter zhangjianzhongii TaxID=2974574 RepID=A0ACC6FSD9_9HELI|nr:proline dehydrogenase family protein [Helicobacter sp. XJK30-2]MDL0081992.1 bifunctional proline dehydrogenase/L-glutamate gamma-semialdehyde dehydrogenase [Helicobacter sp. XJK30-2]